MAWLVHRNATSEDKERLEKSARRFCDRHGIWYNVEEMSCSDAIDHEIWMLNYHSDPDAKKLERLWFRCTERALDSKGAEGIAWNTVGEHVKD